MTNEIQILNQIGTSAAQIAISEYSRWIMASSIIWMIFGIIMLVVGIKIFFHKFEDDDNKFYARIWVSIIIIIALIIISCQVSDICAPKGAAIHMLIKDVMQRDGNR